jgi:predicted Fe-Mo cluster-binding NifX family protein
MRYLVVATAGDLDAKVHKRFGHADVFLVVDSETLEFTVMKGVGHEEPHHGIGRFDGKGINRVIVGNIGPEAFKDVRAVGWEVFLCRNMTVREAIKKVHSGELSPLEAATMKQSIHEGQAHDAHGKLPTAQGRGEVTTKDK